MRMIAVSRVAIEMRFIVGFNEVEDYQRRVAVNGNVPKLEVRQSVLAFFGRKPMEMQWGTSALFELGLSEDQTLDALHWLEDEGAIDYGGKRSFLGGNWQWQVKLTTHGRDLADGTVAISPHLATTVVVQQTFHGPVTNAGLVQGDVNQTIVTFPALPSDVRDELVATSAGEALVDALEEERVRPRPRPEKVRKIVAGIKELMDTANTASDFWNHFTEWSAEVGAWIGDVVGGLVDGL